MQHELEGLHKHISFLQSLDTDDFYEKDEDEVRQYAHEAITSLVHMGAEATSEVVELLETEFTWSSYFALKILRETKDPHAVPYLIEFLRRESDDAMANEEAMFALQDIGDASIDPLLEVVEEEFNHKHYNFYLVGAFTGIIGPAPYDFMVNITKDFLQNHHHYHGWFHIDDFTYNFVKQERKDVLPLLKQILELNVLSGDERREIRDTIDVLEHPEQYYRDMQDMIDDLSKES